MSMRPGRRSWCVGTNWVFVGGGLARRQSPPDPSAPLHLTRRTIRTYGNHIYPIYLYDAFRARSLPLTVLIPALILK